jgi:phosphate transport system substrate-binding protein
MLRLFVRIRLDLACCIMSALLSTTASLAAEPLRIGGTGMALALTTTLAERSGLAGAGMPITVLPSLGTPGGLKALGEGEIDIALAGRALNGSEIAAGFKEELCLTTPLVFATSHPSPGALAKEQLPLIYAAPQPVWPDGKPLRIILRARSGSENPYLAKVIPGMQQAIEAAFKRPGVPVGATDQENADLALRTESSLTVMTLLQVRSERLNLRAVPIDGIEPSAETLASGAYPYSIRVCLVTSSRRNPAMTPFLDFTRSSQGKAIVGAAGAVLAD